MNPFAYYITGLGVKMLHNVSKARINIHGADKIPDGSILFVINHFTRMETFFLPYHINLITRKPVWSLAESYLFKGTFGSYLEKVGALSTKDPERDLLIVKTLLTGEATWIIFPEGRMVKNKKIMDGRHFMISHDSGVHPPHTGAATLALRTEFYRQRLKAIEEVYPDEARRLLSRFHIDNPGQVSERNTYIVPVNITYYPIRAKENALSKLAVNLVENIPERMVEEIMTEGFMILSGVDVDIRFGEPINIASYLKPDPVVRDIRAGRQINFDDPIPSRRLMRKIALRIMKTYMKAIYEMTTVNHDHLFAGILKYISGKRVSGSLLKKKAYLATLTCLENTGIYKHHSLKGSQAHILTDDSFAKYFDFISLAREKEVVSVDENGIIEKKPGHLGSQFEFHRVRIDNPIAVIANELEPLKPFQKRLKKIARMSEWRVKKDIVKFLLKKSEEDYQKDYEKYYIEGESKEMEIGRPYLIRGKSRRLGVLLVHGHLASPMEVRGLAEHLSKMGYWVFAPRLKGHGTSPEDLAVKTYSDWVGSVDEGYAIISNICDKVIAGGFSTGAGLALDLAYRVQDIRAVFAICPPMRLQGRSSKFASTVDAWNRLMKRVMFEGAQREFVENRPENSHISYLRSPVAGIKQLLRMMDDLEEKLPHIQAPALVIQSAGDPVVDKRGTKRIYELLGSDDKQYLLMNFNRHGILIGEGSERVYRAVSGFINDIDIATSQKY